MPGVGTGSGHSSRARSDTLKVSDTCMHTTTAAISQHPTAPAAAAWCLPTAAIGLLACLPDLGGVVVGAEDIEEEQVLLHHVPQRVVRWAQRTAAVQHTEAARETRSRVVKTVVSCSGR